MNIVVVDQRHAFRSETEDFISQVYCDHYGATVPFFPSSLVAMKDRRGTILCAAGLRYASDGFFSESYLDRPVEAALGASSGSDVSRDDIFEVTTMASRAPRAATDFLRRIVAYGETAGFEWAFFTATDRLRQLLWRIELPIVTLAPAIPARVRHPEAWGTYYRSDPYVCAVNRDASARFLSHRNVKAQINA